MNTSVETISMTDEANEFEQFCFECAHETSIYLYGVKYFNRFFTPIVLIFGVIGNVISLIVLQSSFYASSSTCVGLSALNVADTCVILFRGIYHWLRYGFDIHIHILSDPFCKFLQYAIHVSEQFSGMFLTVTTVERVLAVWFPLHVKDWMTKKRMVVVCITVSIFLLCLYSFLAVDHKIQYILWLYILWLAEYFSYDLLLVD